MKATVLKAAEYIFDEAAAGFLHLGLDAAWILEFIMIKVKGNVVEANGQTVKVQITCKSLHGTTEYEGTALNDCDAVVGDLVSVQIHSSASLWLTAMAYSVSFLILLSGLGVGAIVGTAWANTTILHVRGLVVFAGILLGAILVRGAMREVYKLSRQWKSSPCALRARKVLRRQAANK